MKHCKKCIKELHVFLWHTILVVIYHFIIHVIGMPTVQLIVILYNARVLK